MTARSWVTGRDRTLWILVAVAGLPLSVGAQERAPVADTARETSGQAVRITAHFAFFSDFQTNLNDALIAAGLARKEGTVEPFTASGESACLETLPAAEPVSRRTGPRGTLLHDG